MSLAQTRVKLLANGSQGRTSPIRDLQQHHPVNSIRMIGAIAESQARPARWHCDIPSFRTVAQNHNSWQAHPQADTRHQQRLHTAAQREAEHKHWQQGHCSSADIARPPPLAPIVPLPVRVPLPPTLARPVRSRYTCRFENAAVRSAPLAQACARCKECTTSGHCCLISQANHVSASAESCR